jgi:predicted nucleic acid-binding protein
LRGTVYLETTIASYLTARESRDPIAIGRREMTSLWWDEYRSFFDLCVSELVISESRQGDSEAAQRRLKFLDGLPSLEISDQSEQLASELVASRIIPEQYAEDALHIALCAVHQIDYLLTWNCRHLANAVLRRRIERIVEARGYACPVICTPEELMDEHGI